MLSTWIKTGVRNLQWRMVPAWPSRGAANSRFPPAQRFSGERIETGNIRPAASGSEKLRYIGRPARRGVLALRPSAEDAGPVQMGARDGPLAGARTGRFYGVDGRQGAILGGNHRGR